MRALQSQLPRKHRLSQEWRRALQLLASNPRGTTEDMLVVGHGLSADMLAMLVLAGLAKVVTETLRAEGGTFTGERLQITEPGQRALEGRHRGSSPRPDRVYPGTPPLRPELACCVRLSGRPHAAPDLVYGDVARHQRH
jgi:hypothetical protein